MLQPEDGCIKERITTSTPCGTVCKNNNNPNNLLNATHASILYPQWRIELNGDWLASKLYPYGERI
jgi:hypothetical protein